MPRDNSDKRKYKDNVEERQQRIPRPPNAWILYRADQLRRIRASLTRVEMQGMQQSDASKIIGDMWRREPPEVREYYERLAEQKKAEHSLKHPNYKYQPRSKEQKDREREQTKQRKGQGARSQEATGSTPGPSSSGPLPSALPQNIPPPALLPPGIQPMFYPQLHYGNAGPTPPLSAAPSPTEVDSDEQPETPNNASPSTSASAIFDNCRNGTPSIQNPRPTYPPAVPQTLLHPQESLVSPPTFPSFGSQWPSPAQTPALGGQATSWDATGSSAAQQVRRVQDPLTFNLPGPSVSSDTNDFWSFLGQGQGAGDHDNYSALLSATGDPSIYQLHNFDPSLPSGEIEITSGSVNATLELARLFGHDLTQPMPDPFSQPLENSFPLLTQSNEFTEIPLLFTDNTTPPSHVLPNLDFSAYDADDYLNFDAAGTMSGMPSTADASQQTIATSSATTSYVPPPGAALAGTRRVGGSWKIPVIDVDDSSAEEKPHSTYRVPSS